MTREWKPGDVAFVPGVGRALVTSPGFWATEDSSRVHVPVTGGFSDVRRLVVIDPEDREQVEWLYAAWRDQPLTDSRARLQAALRSLVADPRPEEPLGLGAVVELADGRTAVRAGRSRGPWSHFKDGVDVLDRYEDLDVVRVLSEGVPS